MYRAELRALSGLDQQRRWPRRRITRPGRTWKPRRDEIAKILDPKFAPPAPAAGTTGGGRGGE